LVVALIGLTLSVCGSWVAKRLDPPPPPPRPPEELVADIKAGVAAKLRGEKLPPVAPAPRRWSERIPAIALVTSFVGLALGAFGLICHEHIRVAAAAIAVGASGFLLEVFLVYDAVHDSFF
jgi:hypothetical protein